MNINRLFTFTTSALAMVLMAANQPVESQSASVKFQATTNVSAISIHGQSSDLRVQANVSHENGQLVLEALEARLDPKNLSTGMALRDNHMREKIFSNGTPTAPMLSFNSPRVLCPEPAKGQETTCNVSGTFTMRGIQKPFAIPMRIKSDGARYKVTGEGPIKISEYGIEPPCQLGVCVADAVKLRIEVQAEERVTSSKSEGVRR